MIRAQVPSSYQRRSDQRSFFIHRIGALHQEFEIGDTVAGYLALDQRIRAADRYSTCCVRFSTLPNAASENVTLLCTPSMPPPANSVIVSVLLPTP
ncbi:hypothetical protein [Defluviicoccus vanus]|uniref:Uncharacterized protein n=1 Tax=Defluviicoccus vanus TaxID=111831 RepID=A0A7H1MZG9_9PROT|nr:hypothetical protein [Defluviicoccus vanus]QNT68855.1 hypothetical protein HQ394_05155 [Defluviicoccus vanus]